MSRVGHPLARGLAVVMGALGLLAITFAAAPVAGAQIDLDPIIADLERQGYHIEPGGEGDVSRFRDLVRKGEASGDTWYFVSMADVVDPEFADDLRALVSPEGNVLVFYLEEFDGELFDNVQLATGYDPSIQDAALRPFDGDWSIPSEFMAEVVDELDRLAPSTAGAGASDADASSTTSGSGSSGSATTTPTTTTTTTTTTTSGGSGSSDSGGVPGWLLVLVPASLIGGGVWFARRRGRNKADEAELERAEKIRAEIRNELDELANDVIVLAGPVDLSEDATAIQHYRDATATYNEISDALPDPAKLVDADLNELSELGARVANARWQMDAAEAIIAGEPIPDKPKVAPPPQPPRPPEAPAPAPRPLPQRAPRPRVPYSPSRRRSGGGLLDILIAGGSMMGRSRSRRRGGGMFGGGGGMFGGGSRRTSYEPRRTPTTTRRPGGGGVFGSGSSSSRSRSSGRTSSRSRSRSSRSSSRSRSRSSSRSRVSSSRGSSSRRRRRSR